MSKYYKTLFNKNEDQQILIHNIRNHLLSIARLNESNEREEINRYLNTLLNSSELQNSIHVSDNELLNSILCHYIQICETEHIEFNIDVRKKVLTEFNYSDLTSLFGNLLDNAIEACSNFSNSYIELSITTKENTDITIINIVNNCRTEPKFNKYGTPVSTKKNKFQHGFGIKSVERVVKKYNGNITMYFDSAKSTFHTIIALKGQNS